MRSIFSKQSFTKSLKITNADKEQNLNACRVIADHIRSASFMIADGIMPSNEGRGYVLRRIMRRAMRYVHNIGYKEPILHKLTPVLLEQMSETFPELNRAKAAMDKIMLIEEENFGTTLGKGMKILENEIQNLITGENLAGSTAFKLYDTYGFPLDLTIDIMRQKGISVDTQGFHKEMESQKNRAKIAWRGSGNEKIDSLWHDLYEEFGKTSFTGYTNTQSKSKVLAIIVDGHKVCETSSGHDDAIVILDHTPFYAESGGQVSDRGSIQNNLVKDVKKIEGGLHLHYISTTHPLKVGEIVETKIDISRRRHLSSNHSATHILHKALRDILGEHIVQKGSLVEVEKLRFDFSHNQALTEQEIQAVQEKVNQVIESNNIVNSATMKAEDAISSGALALFGEKYDKEVRVISISDSAELCGGTHVKHSSEIGVFKIISEESIASGIRRITAKTGKHAMQYLEDAQNEKDAQISEFKKTNKELNKKLSESTIENIISSTKHDSRIIGGIEVYCYKFDNMDIKSSKTLLDKLRSKNNNCIIILSIIDKARVSLCISITKNLSARVQANNLIKNTAHHINGKGGGNPQIAQAGGDKINGIDEAISQIYQHLIDNLDHDESKLSIDERDIIIWHNGEFKHIKDAKINIMTHALHYGSSVFEGIRIYNGKTFKVHEHLERLYQSAKTLYMTSPYTIKEVADAIESLVSRNNIMNGYIRPIIWRGSGETILAGTKCKINVAVIAWESFKHFKEKKSNHSVKLCISELRKPSANSIPPNLKAAGLYTFLGMAKNYALTKGCDDALLLDTEDNITEATVSNIFFIFNNEIHTPTAGQFLSGITRDIVIKVSKNMGIKVVESPINIEKINAADAAFLTGTAIEIMPIKSIINEAGQTIQYDITHSLIHSIMKEYETITKL